MLDKRVRVIVGTSAIGYILDKGLRMTTGAGFMKVSHAALSVDNSNMLHCII